MRAFIRTAIFSALILALPLAAQVSSKDAAKSADLSSGITRQQADEILNELRQIRQLLEKQQRAAEPPVIKARLDLKGFQMLGNKDAPITMVEFTDYQCPYCQRFHKNTFGELKKNYIDTGKVRFYSRDLPLVDSHPDALRAAQAGRCAADQGQFWALRDLMAAEPSKLDLENLAKYAGDLKMDVPAFRSCVESDKYKSAVRKDIDEAMKIGATGTPTFVVGKSIPDGVDGELVIGALPYESFDEKLKDLESAQ
jgi:protein-disulfide isomerase